MGSPVESTKMRVLLFLAIAVSCTFASFSWFSTSVNLEGYCAISADGMQYNCSMHGWQDEYKWEVTDNVTVNSDENTTTELLSITAKEEDRYTFGTMVAPGVGLLGAQIDNVGLGAGCYTVRSGTGAFAGVQASAAMSGQADLSTGSSYMRLTIQ